VDLVEAYAKEQGMFHGVSDTEPCSQRPSSSTCRPWCEHRRAGPSQDLVTLAGAGSSYRQALGRDQRSGAATMADGSSATVSDGDVVVAAITSCTNTSNPQVMVAAGLIAQRAVAVASSPSLG